VGGVVGAFGIAARFSLGSVITLNAPVPIGPLTNAQTSTRPALRVTNAVRSGTAGAITYTFDIASNAAFTAIVISATVVEGVNETGFIPTTDLPTSNNLLFWRATAVDAASGTVSATSSVQSFTVIPSQAGLLAQQRGVVLWPGAQPPGTVGNATLGGGWGIQTFTDFLGNVVQSPTVEVLRVFDLLDRGMTPDGAFAWMNGNGYPTAAVYYSSVQAIGFQSQYMAFISGAWALVVRNGA
jgi:hypothetical protein